MLNASNQSLQILALAVLTACSASATTPGEPDVKTDAPYVVVLGIGQDAGYPQAGTKEHPAWDDPTLRRHAASLAVVDPKSSERWLFEATPDFKEQLHRLDVLAPVEGRPGLAGIFLTHGHMGHYTGLMHLGHEAIGADKVPVYAMPRMQAFLRDNGPWGQLVEMENIVLKPLRDRREVRLSERLTVTPVTVPHRDEYTETVGYVIRGPNRAVLFIPDIDKWERWDEAGDRVEDWIARVDVAYLDGSFFENGEIPGRDMASIPHPFMRESMKRFAALPAAERRKIRFIHLNRTNPAIIDDSPARQAIEDAGFTVARELERVGL
jgi:pyrroloquinoline quinone biosynthesis protein B